MKKSAKIISAILIIIVEIYVPIKIIYGTRSFYSYESIPNRDAYFFMLEQGSTQEQLNKEEQLAELGEFNNYYFQFRRTLDLFFTSFGETLIGEYSEKNYLLQKEKMLNHYTFFTASVTSENGENLLTEPEFDIGDWHFKVIDEENTFLPRYFRILGYNDENNTIAVLTFCDQDLDAIDEDMNTFVKRYFKYNFERN